MAEGFLDIDCEDPDFDATDFSVRYGERGSMLLRHDGHWTHLRAAGEGFISIGD